MDLVRLIWSGQMLLWRVYWLYWIGGNLFFAFVSEYIGAVHDGNVAMMSTALLVYLTTIAYTIIVAVGVWRSANNYTGSKAYQVLAKLSIVMAVLRTVVDFAALLGVK